MAAAACNRQNLQLLFVSKKELLKLAAAEPAVFAAAAAAGQEPPPSLLSRLVVRLKYAGAYQLLPVEQLLVSAEGAHGLAVMSPDPQQRDALLRASLSSASGTNPLTDEQWEAAGRAEVEQLAALLQQRGQSLSVAEVAAAAWRKQAALAWYAQHGAQPPAEQQRHLPALLQQLADEQGIAELQQQVQPEQRQRRQQPEGFTVQLHQPALGTLGTSAAVQLPGQAAANTLQQPPAQQAQHVANGGTAGMALPADGPAAPPAAAAADFLAGLERQLVHATAHSAADGSSDGTAAVVADIQRQLLELKQQLLAQQQQQPVAAAPAHPAWHASSSSGDHLSPYVGPAMHRGLHPSPPLPAWQLQQGGFLPGPAHQALPAAASPRQAWQGESASPRGPSHGLGRRPGRQASRSPSPRRQWRAPLAEPPLVPAAICHFKYGNRVDWELVGREIFVSGLPTCDGVRVHRREVARRLSALIESTGTTVEDVKVNNGDERGNTAYVTVATARHAARAIEMLQGAELMGRQLFIRPFRTEVDALKRRFPEAAAEAARALRDLAAQGPPWGPGPPPHLRGPPPHMRGGSPPPFRDRSPPPFRDLSPSPFRGGSPPPFRGRSPPRVVEERGRKRARSGGRSMSPGRRAARSVSPDAILAPVLVDHFLQRGGQREWMLTGREVQVTGLRDSRDDAAVWQQVMPLVAAAGGTVTDRRVAGGDARGPLVHLTLATAQQAAAVIECLQGVEVGGGQLHLRPIQQEVEDKCRRYPEAAAAAKRVLAAAAGGSSGGGQPRSSSPVNGSKRNRGEVGRAEGPPPRRGSPGPGGQQASRGADKGGSKEGKPSSSGGSGSVFWDPVYRLERRCLSLLQSRGPTTVSALFGELGAVPPPCGPLNTALLRRFLDRRPHLFRVDREDVEPAEGAAAVLRYKRELLQYLANRPPRARVTPGQLEEEMPPPSSLPRHLAAQGALHFVRELLWREVEVVSDDQSIRSVDLRPFPPERDDFRAAREAGYEPPLFNQPCRFFWKLNGTWASCTHGLFCRFGHASPREDFL